MDDLTPRQIVVELDRHIIGQANAKRSVAVAIRDRWRRQQLDPEFAREVTPRNIIMIGPTGVGKTEIARRLARLTGAPFIKVEASKYTEVGYHGRDVESMVRDLLELGIKMVREEHGQRVKEQAASAVEERLISLLLGRDDENAQSPATSTPDAGASATAPDDGIASNDAVRDRMREKLREGLFDDSQVDITVRDKANPAAMGMGGPDQLDPSITGMLESLIPERRRQRTVTVARARTILLEEEKDRLIDGEKTVEQAIERTEEAGIIFLDEIDKIATSERSGADVSREGVQRDLLPIVEGSSVNTRHGVVRTDQILFVAAGAFHVSSVSDLMPELQGRFPIRVELDALTREDFRRILVEPHASLTSQQTALLETEGLAITFDDAAIDAMAELAAEANERLENIGARRLMTVIARVFEAISFDAPDRVAGGETAIAISAEFVRERLADVLKDEDVSRFVL